MNKELDRVITESKEMACKTILLPGMNTHEYFGSERWMKKKELWLGAAIGMALTASIAKAQNENPKLKIVDDTDEIIRIQKIITSDVVERFDLTGWTEGSVEAVISKSLDIHRYLLIPGEWE